MTDLKGKNIIILGGTGTLGKSLTRHLAEEFSDIHCLTIFSRDEVKQLEMMEEFASAPFKITYVLGDVRDESRLVEVLKGKDIVIHAAAIKHIVMAEKNPEECFKTNVGGTQNVVAACAINGIEKVLLISTDKAVNPIGVYGESKMEAERLFLEANANTIFSIVRLGNIIGSRGSVFEVFERQKKKGVLKVTHEDATRFCIGQEDAAAFVMKTVLEMQGREIQSPKMKAFRILDLAKSIGPECEIEFTGLRKGDKLHEELNGLSSAECLGKSLAIENNVLG